MEEKTIVEKMITYRYMWLLEDDEKLYIDIVCGTEERHKLFVDSLQNNVKVRNACRVYVNEIDIVRVEQFETIVSKGVEENEKA